MDTIEQMLIKNNIDFRASTSDNKLLRKLNKIMRSIDCSDLWPILGKYNATNRAIHYYSRVYFNANGPVTALEYCLGIDHLISNYVNGRN